MIFKTGNVSNTFRLYSSFSIFTLLAYLITHLLLQSCEISEGTSTIKPHPKFCLEKDIETLYEVAKKVPNRAPDGGRMVRIVCHRSRDQRLQMKSAFRDKYKEDIAKYCGGAADGEISLGDLLEDCFRSVLGIYKHHLNWELTGRFKTVDEDSVLEILLSIPPQEKQKFLSAYHETFKCTLDQHIQDNIPYIDTTTLFLTMVNKTRLPDIPPEKIDWELAKKEAKTLHDGRKKWKDHSEDLDRILLETPLQQLNATFAEFQKINGKEIDEVMKKKLGSLKKYYRAMVFFAKNPQEYYAGRLQKAMEGCGTQDHVLNRIVTIHSEDDLVEIATRFQLNTADSLIQAIEADTTFHHEMLLTCLAGKTTLKEQ